MPAKFVVTWKSRRQNDPERPRYHELDPFALDPAAPDVERPPMIVSDLVMDEVRKRLSPQGAERAIALLQSSELPMLGGDDRTRERNRVHLACLKIANGDIAKFEQAVAIAKVDWRDVLVASGLGNLNWPRVLASAGFPVP